MTDKTDNLNHSETNDSFRLDFVMVGAQRSASTWLYECLNEHPDICLGKGKNKKEINYFDSEKNWSEGNDWYISHFARIDNQKCGEICPDYIISELAIKRLSNCYPDSKIIMVLREPYARALSAYKLFFQSGNIPFKTLMQDHSHDLIARGLYSSQIKRLFNYFSKDNILFVEYESILNDPLKVITSIFDFLGVDSTYTPTKLKNSYNKGVFKKTQKVMSSIGFGFLIDKFKRTILGKFIRESLVNNKSTKLNISLLSNDTSELFYKDIIETEKLIDIDLNRWKANK